MEHCNSVRLKDRQTEMEFYGKVLRSGRNVVVRSTRMIFSLLLFLTLGFLSTLHAQPAPSFLVKAIQLNTAADIESKIEHVRTLGFNAIQFSGELGAGGNQLEDPARLELVRLAIKRAKEIGLNTAVRVHELEAIPAEYLVTGRIDLDNPDFWEFLRKRYADLLETKLPEVDGIVLDIHQSSRSVLRNDGITSSLDPVQRVVKLIRFLHGVVTGHEKQLIVRNYATEPAEVSLIQQIFAELSKTIGPHELVVMTKEVPHDWQPFFPHNPLIGTVSGFDQIVETSIGGENYGRNLFPYDQIDYLKHRLKYAKDQGNVIGGVAGVEDPGSYSVFGTPNEMVVWAYTRLLDKITSDTDALRLAWAKVRYGVQGAEFIRSALERSFDIVNLTFFPIGEWYAERSGIPAFSDVSARLAFAGRSAWDPRYRDITRALFSPNTRTLEDIESETERALYLLSLSLEDLDRARPFLKTEDYEDLFSRFKLLEDVITAFRLHKRVYFGYQYHAVSGEGKDEVTAGIKAIRDFAKELDQRCGDTCYPVNGRSLQQDLRSFTTEVETLLELPQIVIETARKTWSDRPLGRIEAITASGKPAYSFTTENQNLVSKLIVDTEGNLLEEIEELRLEDLPKEVSDAYRWVIRHEPPETVRIQRSSRRAMIIYSIEAESPNYDYRMKIADYGRILEESAERRATQAGM